MKKLLPFFAFAVLTLAACSKNSDTTKPVIMVITPQNNQTFSSGQTVNISASISDERELHGVHIMVTDQNGGHVIHDEYHPDTKTYSINKSFAAQSGAVYSIEIGAEDHNQNETTVQLKVSTQ